VKPLMALVLAVLVQDEKPGPKIELKGCMKVEGISFRQGQTTKYSGDTFLVKLLFTDEKGATIQPTPTLNFVVYNGQEPYKKVQRIVTKEQWKADVAKINKDTVADNTIASDNLTKATDSGGFQMVAVRAMSYGAVATTRMTASARSGELNRFQSAAKRHASAADWMMPRPIPPACGRFSVHGPTR